MSSVFLDDRGILVWRYGVMEWVVALVWITVLVSAREVESRVSEKYSVFGSSSRHTQTGYRQVKPLLE